MISSLETELTIEALMFPRKCCGLEVYLRELCVNEYIYMDSYQVLLQTSPKNDSDVLKTITYGTDKLMLLIKLVWNPYHGKEESWVGGIGSQSPEPSWILSEEMLAFIHRFVSGT